MNISGIKTVVRGIVMFLAIIAVIFFSIVPKAIAGDYMGEFCWSLHKTETYPPESEATGIMKFGVTHMGDTYYSLQGYGTSPGNNVILDCTAVIVENKVFMSCYNTQDDGQEPQRAGGILQIQLDIATLNGTFWGISNNFNTLTHEFKNVYTAGTLTLTTCP